MKSIFSHKVIIYQTKMIILILYSKTKKMSEARLSQGCDSPWSDKSHFSHVIDYVGWSVQCLESLRKKIDPRSFFKILVSIRVGGDMVIGIVAVVIA